MQTRNTFIFHPNDLKLDKCGKLEGFYHQFNDNDAYYITNNSIVDDSTQIIGYVDNTSVKYRNLIKKSLHVDYKTKKFTILNSKNSNIIQITYNLKDFTKCDEILMSNCGEHFRILIEYLQEKTTITAQNGHRNYIKNLLTIIAFCLNHIIMILDKTKQLLSKSAILSHLYNNLQALKWFFNEINTRRPSKIKIGNMITSKIIDLIIGVFILKYLIIHQNDIMELISETREIIIYNLRELLTYLMGSPIGLKLNKAFNNCLGTFFFYHISLWRIFLQNIHPVFERYFSLLILPGILGVSYQIALISDIISIATFHVYCIYVYAARLIHVQLSTLLSLFRLFIGRKYNPLRQRVDSYQYSQHQLFLGVLGFTVLLFLLPTTLLYYTVFTIFRLLIVLFEWILHQIRIILNQLPVYILLLWLCNSTELSGTLYIKWQISDDVPKVEAHLNRSSLFESIRKFTINNNCTIRRPWGVILKKIVTGVLI